MDPHELACRSRNDGLLPLYFLPFSWLRPQAALGVIRVYTAAKPDGANHESSLSSRGTVFFWSLPFFGFGLTDVFEVAMALLSESFVDFEPLVAEADFPGVAFGFPLAGLDFSAAALVEPFSELDLP